MPQERPSLSFFFALRRCYAIDETRIIGSWWLYVVPAQYEWRGTLPLSKAQI